MKKKGKKKKGKNQNSTVWEMPNLAKEKNLPMWISVCEKDILAGEPFKLCSDQKHNTP